MQYHPDLRIVRNDDYAPGDIRANHFLRGGNAPSSLPKAIMKNQSTAVVTRVTSNQGDGYIEIQVRGQTSIRIRMSLENYAKAVTGLISPCDVEISD